MFDQEVTYYLTHWELFIIFSNVFRLWHQLTLKVEEFVKNPALQKGDALIKLYNNFIYVFENRWKYLPYLFIINFYSIKFACVYYVKLHGNEFFLFSFGLNKKCCCFPPNPLFLFRPLTPLTFSRVLYYYYNRHRYWRESIITHRGRGFAVVVVFPFPFLENFYEKENFRLFISFYGKKNLQNPGFSIVFWSEQQK